MSAISLASPSSSSPPTFGRRQRRPVCLPPHMRRQDREEAVAEARAAAWSAWHGLIRRGKDPLAVGVTAIAINAIRYVRNGRRVGNTSCGPAPGTSSAGPSRPAATRSSASTPTRVTAVGW